MSKFYSKEKVIGSGTYGNVWLVKSNINSGLYVLKEVNLATLNTSERQQALNEVSILSQCKHENIIRYKDAVIDHCKGVLSIVMEYADGGDLYSAIIQQRGVPFKEHIVITWFIQMCLALQCIHQKNILHRDLKTRNIFLTKNNVIKLGDFGIARCLLEANQLATTAIGTPYYLSPEICQRKPYNHKSDIWALGCILFEIAALSHPFQACSFPHLLSLILTGQRKELPRHCSSLIQDLIQLLLNEYPDDRPSADEILALPCVQPYLNDAWISQGSRHMPQLLSQKIDIRCHSLCENSTPVKDAATRRASIAAVDTKSIKGLFRAASNSQEIPKLRSSSISRSHSIQGQKNSVSRNSAKTDYHSLTYKVFRPFISKKLSGKSSRNTYDVNNPNVKHNKSTLRCIDFKSKHQRNEESDCGYQSEEPFKTFSFKVLKSKFSPVETSTKKDIDVEKLLPKKFNVCDDVFQSKSHEAEPSHKCKHSQCQQCMLDMLWKNRIRGTVGPLIYKERSEFIQNLQSVFNGDLFDVVYKALVSHWELNESDSLPDTLKELTNSLNYSQMQHLPLMMQLVQLDIIRN